MLGSLVKQPLKIFLNIQSKLREHSLNQYHKEACIFIDDFKRNFMNPSQRVDSILQKLSKEQFTKNGYMLKKIIKSIIFCAVNNLSLRGSNDNQALDFENHQYSLGVFRNLIKYQCESDHIFKKMLESAPKNSNYLSLHVQNECLSIISGLTLENLKSDLGDRRFSILFDETTDISTVEQMTIVIRYVNSNSSI